MLELELEWDKITALIISAAGVTLSIGRLIQRINQLEKRVGRVEDETVSKEVFDLQIQHNNDMIKELKEGVKGIHERLDTLNENILTVVREQSSDERFSKRGKI